MSFKSLADAIDLLLHFSKPRLLRMAAQSTELFNGSGQFAHEKIVVLLQTRDRASTEF